eukprot:8358274-Pyramimonas_sp.AAC.1
MRPHHRPYPRLAGTGWCLDGRSLAYFETRRSGKLWAQAEKDQGGCPLGSAPSPPRSGRRSAAAAPQSVTAAAAQGEARSAPSGTAARPQTPHR